MLLTSYVINEDYEKFYNRINEVKVFDRKISYMFESDDGFRYHVVEATLFDERIVIYFDGQFSEIKVFIKYGVFLNHKEFYERILSFDKKLLDLFSDITSIYRVSEGLLENLQIENGELWFRDENAFERFEKWIRQEEKSHWLEIQKPYEPILYEDFLLRYNCY